MTTMLDPAQAVRQAFDDASNSFRVNGINTTLVTEPYDYIGLTYVPSGNGTGQISTAVYKSGGSGGTTVATLTMAYDVSNNLSSITKT